MAIQDVAAYKSYGNIMHLRRQEEADLTIQQ
jgi:hypothetical protein